MRTFCMIPECGDIAYVRPEYGSKGPCPSLKQGRRNVALALGDCGTSSMGAAEKVRVKPAERGSPRANSHLVHSQDLHPL